MMNNTQYRDSTKLRWSKMMVDVPRLMIVSLLLFGNKASLFGCSAQLISSNRGRRRMMKTPAPTPYPTEMPTTTTLPSYSPSTSPTSPPTLTPSMAPSTPLPSESPSSSPTTIPTISPTDNPTMTPTISPNPTSSPTVAPTAAEKVIAVALPTIGIDLVINDEDATNFDVTLLRLFVANILDINSGVDTFDSVQLEFDVIQSEFDRRNRNRQLLSTTTTLRSQRTRNLETGISVQIGGQAYFQEREAPTEDSLTQTLRAYFSFWGDHDLEAYLKAVGVPSATVASVSVDGEKIQKLDEDGGNSNSNRPGANVEDPSTTNNTDESTLSAGIIAGLAAGIFVLLMVIAYLVYQCRRGNKSEHGGRGGATAVSRSVSGRSSSGFNRDRFSKKKSSTKKLEQIDTGRIGARPNRYEPSQSMTPKTVQSSSSPREYMEEAAPDNVSVDMSLDMSLYTTDESIISSRRDRNVVKATYDPSRLDRVIAAAKQNSSSAASTKQMSSTFGSSSPER